MALYVDLFYFHQSILLHTIHCRPPTVNGHTGIFLFNLSGTMAEERPPTTDPYFATKNKMNNINGLEDIILLPTQATTHERDGLDLLVCPPFPRAGEVGRQLHQAQTVCGRVHTTLLDYKEGSEMVCGGVDMTHQTSDVTEHNSEVGINFGVMDTHGHTTLHYIPQQVPQPEITTHYTPAAFTSDFAYERQIEEGESMPNSWLPIAATENPPCSHTGVCVRKDHMNVLTSESELNSANTH